jgi:hypothetical protein
MTEMGSSKRDRVLNVRLIESEAAMLAALAEREGMSVSDWVRVTLRVEHALAFGQSGGKRRIRARGDDQGIPHARARGDHK